MNEKKKRERIRGTDRLARIISVVTLAGLLGLLVYTLLGPVEAPVARSYACSVYTEQGCAKQVIASGGELEVQSGGVLDVQDGATFGVGGLYPALAAEIGMEVFCASETITGTLAITTATHGVTTPTIAIAQLGSAPGATAGDAFLAYAVRVGSTITLTTVQDDATVATTTATVDYCVIGTD